MFKKEIEFIQDLYHTKEFIALHQPFFDEDEKQLVLNCIDSGFVSSVGKEVIEFEEKIAKYCGVKKAVACVNGTSGLHLALILCDVQANDFVITQDLTFIATANAIKYCYANPIFIDIDKSTLGLSPEKLEDFLKKNQKLNVKAVIAMHSFGSPCKIDEIKLICNKYNLKLIEDCAESLGSFYKDKHTGNFGDIGVISFNGNKIITTGGGGMLLFNDEELAKKAKHLSTQAKVSHPWEFIHDQVGYNYRMPNINAALGLAQFAKLEKLLEKKRQLAKKYQDFFADRFFCEPNNSYSNYWLNSIFMDNKNHQQQFLATTNHHKIMTRPVWRLMHKLEMFKNSITDDLSSANWVEDRLVNIPSWVNL